MSEMGWGLDLEGMSGEDVESRQQIGAPGWYRCVLDDTHEDEKSPGVQVFVFKVTHGPFKGSVVYDRLWHPDLATDVEKSKKAKQRAGLYGKRLGLWSGEKGDPFDPTWEEAIGREVVLQVENSPYPDKTTKVMRDNYKPKWAGLFDLGNDKLPPEALVACGLPPRKAAAAPDPGPPQDINVVPNAAARAAGAGKKPAAGTGAGRKPKVDLSSL